MTRREWEDKTKAAPVRTQAGELKARRKKPLDERQLAKEAQRAKNSTASFEWRMMTAVAQGEAQLESAEKVS